MSTYRLKNNAIFQYIYVYYLALGFLLFFFGFNQILKINPGLIINSSAALIPFNGLPVKSFAIINASLLLLLLLISRKFLHLQLYRILIFILFVFFEDLYNTSGLKTNLFLFWFWSLLALCFLPNLSKKSDMRRFYYLVWTVWFQRSIVLSFYFLSGLWKLIGMFMQMFNGEDHILTYKGLSYHLASEIIRTQNRSYLADLIFENTWMNPVMMFSALAIQLSAIYFIFRQEYIWLMGLGLLLFHFGGLFALSIPYPTNFLLVAVLFLLNPLVDSESTNLRR